jgi:Transposase domain (DUF772)
VRALGREPVFQLFCGEEFFQHKTPFDRSSLTRWRQRMGEEKLVSLIQESLATATRTRAARPSDFSRVIVDTTVQPKAVAFPTDPKLMHRASERLVRLGGLFLDHSREAAIPLSARGFLWTPFSISLKDYESTHVATIFHLRFECAGCAATSCQLAVTLEAQTSTRGHSC